MARFPRLARVLKAAADTVAGSRWMSRAATSLGLQRIHRALQRLVFDPYTVELDVEGIQFEFLIASLIGERYKDGNHGRVEVHKARELLEPGDTFVDLGAHHGYFTVFAAKAVGPEGRVVAVEGDPSHVSILEENVRLNDLENVTVLPTAVGAQEGEVLFGGGQVDPPGGRAHEVPATTLDHLVQHFNLDAIDVLKIDVEGHEGAVLEGAEEALSRCEAVMVEIHPEMLRDQERRPVDLLDRFTEAGFELYQAPDEPTAEWVPRGGEPVEERIHVLATRGGDGSQDP